MARITKRLVDSLRPKKTNESEPGDEETAPNSKKMSSPGTRSCGALGFASNRPARAPTSSSTETPKAGANA